MSASRLDRLKLAVFGLEYGDLKSCKDDKAPEETENGSWDALRFAASWTQLEYAIKAVKARARDHNPKYHADGTRSIVSKDFEESTLDGHTQRYWSKISSKVEKSSDAPREEFGPKCRQLLSKAQALAERYGFALMVVFLPRDRDLLTRLYTDTPQAREEIKSFLAQVQEVVPHVVDLTDNSFSDSMNFWLDDPLHFRPEIGARVLEEAIRRSFDTQGSR